MDVRLVTKIVECRRIDAFELCCWRLLRVPWTARRSNQSILKEIYPHYSLEGLIMKLKLQYFGHLIQKTDSNSDGQRSLACCSSWCHRVEHDLMTQQQQTTEMWKRYTHTHTHTYIYIYRKLLEVTAISEMEQTS